MARGASKERAGLRQRFVHFGHVLAAAAGVVGFAAAFAADDGGDLLDDFSGLDFGGEFWRNRGDQGDRAVCSATKDDYTFEEAFQLIDHALERVAVSVEPLDERRDAVDRCGFG